jgi:hypothetical protein
MNKATIICSTCGNPRNLLANECKFCGETDKPIIGAGKLSPYKINLENNMPTVDEALDRFDDELRIVINAGFKLVEVIHGHGSSGVGGKIRRAFREAMEHNRWGHLIKDVYYGEDLVPGREGLIDLNKYHPRLQKELNKTIFGNAGVTLLVMERST